MYHHPFPTPATPGHKDPFQFAPPNLHPPPDMHLSQQSSRSQPQQSHTQQQSHPSHPPRHASNSHSASSSRHGSHAQLSHNHYSETDSEQDDDKVEKDKLEIRREKNRVKQRNLRCRFPTFLSHSGFLLLFVWYANISQYAVQTTLLTLNGTWPTSSLTILLYKMHSQCPNSMKAIFKGGYTILKVFYFAMGWPVMLKA